MGLSNEPYLTWGEGRNPPERGTFRNISQTAQDTVKKFYEFIFTFLKIVLHVLKFSFVFIRCHGNHFLNLGKFRIMLTIYNIAIIKVWSDMELINLVMYIP